MIFDSVALSPGCGADARRTGGSGEPNILSNQTGLDVDHELQKAMYVAIEQLGMLRRFHRDPRQSPQIRADITAVAQWINFLFEQREHIVIEITEQRPDLVTLGGRVVCERCRKGARDNCSKTSGHEDSAPPPIWKAQLEFLLACTKRVGVELFERNCASYNLRKFPDCLAKLANALLRLRRYLSSMGAGETRIEVEYSSESCAECGQPINPPPAAVL
jgi:hypothetical protein